ncbi:MAG: mannosyl-glycoprotein endo-beta-N-acetylglucosamidase [Arcobacter sp.]|nr:MAG: mannosyl-glycoprotein endo-beta-N-acetylglucosamidase [Arcobacter sp.]
MKFLSKVIFLVSAFIITINADASFSKNYYNLHISKQKKYFINFFKKEIEIENRNILEERAFIESLNKNKHLDPKSKEYKELQELQIKYKIQTIYDYSRYLERIDIIPPSLALAQAAVESGWGKSRFFKEANNIFGHWTYNPKIGMLPLRRQSDKKHFIRIFPDLQTSISAYMRNLNRTAAYYEFRLKRKEMRISGEYIDGMKLSSTMSKYSGIGHDYIKILQSIIRKNHLTNFDKEFYNKLKKEKEKEKEKKELIPKKEENEIYRAIKNLFY